MSTLALAVRKAAAPDLPQVNKALSAAFYDDPVFRWITPDDDRRQRTISRYFDAFIAAVRPHDEIYTTDPAGVGAALWVPAGYPPVAEDDAEEFGDWLETIAGEDAPRLFELVELMEAAHPHEPHHYLWFVAVAPDTQSRGIGSKLMAPVLARCDAEGTPAYLEATSARNAELYVRHGFEVIGEITPAGGPTMYPMWRNPRS